MGNIFHTLAMEIRRTNGMLQLPEGCFNFPYADIFLMPIFQDICCKDALLLQQISALII